MKKETFLDIKTIVATAIGGILLLFATIFLTSYVSSPPSRAEFNAHLAEYESTQKSIDDKLTLIKDNQEVILNHLLERK